jgi:hypothetical protein
LFDDVGASSAIRHNLESDDTLQALHAAARGLSSSIRGKLRPEAAGCDPLFVIQFDEASSLLEVIDAKGEWRSSRTLYTALNRVISCLKKYKIWFFFLSTDSRIQKLLPPDSLTSSGRQPLYKQSPARLRAGKDTQDSQLTRFPPFIYFAFDIEGRRAVADRTTRSLELGKSLAQIAEHRHLAMFGRPLWVGYKKDLNQFAKRKLLGGIDPVVYDSATNKDQVFAVLSFRLALDVCTVNPQCMPLVDTAVGSYMRVLDGVDAQLGILSTNAPSEPILALAAMDLLCETESKWPESIDLLLKGFVQKGFFDRGLKGELYARLLLLLAQDALYKTTVPMTVRASSSFSVRQFLTHLLNNFESYVEVIDPAILDARLNFTHFAVTEEPLRVNVMPALLRDLLRTRAALQLCFRQPLIDVLIPIYCGDADEELRLERCSHISLQVKSWDDEASTPKSILGVEFPEDFAAESEAKVARPCCGPGADFLRWWWSRGPKRAPVAAGRDARGAF